MIIQESKKIDLWDIINDENMVIEEKITLLNNNYIYLSYQKLLEECFLYGKDTLYNVLEYELIDNQMFLKLLFKDYEFDNNMYDADGNYKDYYVKDVDCFNELVNVLTDGIYAEYKNYYKINKIDIEKFIGMLEAITATIHKDNRIFLHHYNMNYFYIEYRNIRNNYVIVRHLNYSKIDNITRIGLLFTDYIIDISKIEDSIECLERLKIENKYMYIAEYNNQLLCYVDRCDTFSNSKFILGELV